MSVKDMKKYLADRGVNFTDCFEKSDLRRRIDAVLRGEVAASVIIPTDAAVQPSIMHFPGTINI